MMNRMELPGESWRGWCFSGGRLWSPEGHSFKGTDSSWWSLLVRRADMFTVLLRERDRLRSELAAALAGQAAAARASAAANLPAKNDPQFLPTPMVITGRTYGVSYYEMKDLQHVQS